MSVHYFLNVNVFVCLFLYTKDSEINIYVIFCLSGFFFYNEDVMIA